MCNRGGKSCASPSGTDTSGMPGTLCEISKNSKIKIGGEIMGEEINFGPVYIKSGKYKGIVGKYDDDETDDKGQECAVVYIGLNLMLGDYVLIPHKHLGNVTTEILLSRQQLLFKRMFEFHELISKARTVKMLKEQINILNEFILIEAILHENYIKARFLNNNSGKKIFISHASVDKSFAKTLSTDIANAGHLPWLDEWSIDVGESIPASIAKALRNSDFVLVILSEEAVNSLWVQAEWENKYWDEINTRQVKVLPVLYKKCDIPELLKTKKYADFQVDYSFGLENLLKSINKCE